MYASSGRCSDIFRRLLLKNTAGGQDKPRPESSTPESETEAMVLPPYDFAQMGFDYEGYNFRILECWETVDYPEDDLVAGEIVSEAVFNRNSRVEELLNIEISAVRVPGDESDLWTRFASTVQTHVMAGGRCV